MTITRTSGTEGNSHTTGARILIPIQAVQLIIALGRPSAATKAILIIQFCRRFGKFRSRFVSIEAPASLADALVSAANEGAVSLHPIFVSHLSIPNVVMVPIADKEATWDLFVVWQRGKTAGPLRALLDAMTSRQGS